MLGNHKEFAVFSLLALCAIALVILKPLYGYGIRVLLAPPKIPESAALRLTEENIRLRAQLAELQLVASQLPQKPDTSIRAIVYSRYPLNFKNELLIGAGSRSGIKKGSAVLVGGMLIGKISSVFVETALVQTIFDGKFQLPVRIGADGAEALLAGGSLPALTLIAPSSRIARGDAVYSAGSDFPHGLPIGETADVRASEDKLFLSAPLAVPYDIGNVVAVSVLQ